jgi:hypothetical protein
MGSYGNIANLKSHVSKGGEQSDEKSENRACHFSKKRPNVPFLITHSDSSCLIFTTRIFSF